MKQYNIMYNVGRAKYVVNFHNGAKTHPDGSPFYDIETFKNKVKLNQFIKELSNQGYKSNQYGIQN